ncbi:uncharacterized protein LOC132798634 [Drosophila nasuta]|uniref:uncharacterized protein LOC132798634 n=1 Tax=Drosophila nasuta TaxID=42062 RepID=UPI00295EBC5E|nr:uncharacterized protein LOC132798634 [Drosophila nasuta]
MDSDIQQNKSKFARKTDLEFIGSVLEYCNVNVAPDVRAYLVDHAYTLARDQLLAARCFARFANKSSVEDEDIRMASLDTTDELKFVPTLLPQTKPPGQHLSAPTPAMGLLLPPWRNCQVGVNAQLKQFELEAMERSELMDTDKMPRLGPKNTPREK